MDLFGFGSLTTKKCKKHHFVPIRGNPGTGREGVQSNFWIHVSQTREGFNPPLRPSLRRGSNVTQTREGGFVPPYRRDRTPLPRLSWFHLSDWQSICGLVCMAEWTALPRLSDIGSTCLTGNPFGVSSVWRNELPSLVWLTLDPCLSDGLSGGFNPPFVWLTWIQKLDCTIPMRQKIGPCLPVCIHDIACTGWWAIWCSPI